MEPLTLTFIFSPFVSTLLGGLFALRHRDRLHRILGFAAGVLLGVVAFEILPEIFKLAGDTRLGTSSAMTALVAGFLAFHIVERLILLHAAHETHYDPHHHPHVGVASALALAGHSFLDGAGIGLAFQVNQQVGVAVALAVIAHDFTDGLNTVSLMLLHRGSRRRAKILLLLDALAPLAGAGSTLFFKLSPGSLLIYLGFFAGFLLYIGASEILPEAHADKSSYQTLGLTVLGSGLIFGLSRLA